MIIGAIKEQNTDETRVSLTPLVVKRLVADGFTVILEKKAGLSAGFSDKEYETSGALLTDSAQEIYKKSNLLLQILPPSEDSILLLQPNQILCADFRNYNLEHHKKHARFIRLELVPRTSIAQSIDILSAQSTVRGYTAALYALSRAPKMAPQIMTAAASLKASTALIIGAGVTGLQAASVLKRMGCRVTILDINESYRELALSVGAEFALAPTEEDLINLLNNKDILIGTAAAATGISPQVVNEKQLIALQKNAVIVDTTEKNIAFSPELNPDSFHFYRNTATERLAPFTASELWANNMYNLVNLIKSNENQFNLADPSVAAMLYPPL